MKRIALYILAFISFVEITTAQVNYTARNQVTPYNGRFRAGVNLGYFPPWTNQTLADIAAGNPAVNQIGVGSRAVRQGMYENVLGLFGYDLLVSDMSHYNSLNMANGEAVAILGGPLEWHRDQTSYCPNDPNKKSRLFANLYTPIWDNGANGTPYNDDNYWAAYVYKVVTQYKDDVRFWEIWNEPGLDFGACGWRAPGDPVCNWWDRDPDPCEYELSAPIEHYVRTLRVAYEVIKTIDPDSYVCLGSMGYQAGLDAVLRNTDNPNGGSPTADYPFGGGAYFDCVTMHTYPHFDGSTVNFNGGIFERHSDRAADGVFLFRDTYQSILANYGFNGSTFPKKEWIITEANAPRRMYPGSQYFAGEVAQRNYLQKAIIVAKLEKIGSFHVYELFDQKTPAAANYEFHEMGMYKPINLTNPPTGPYGQQVNDEGIALKTVSDLIFPTDYDPIETAKMGLVPNGPVRGYAFKRADGTYVYALWARTQTDFSEAASATYSFPGSMNLNTLTRYNWNWGYTQATTTVPSTGIFLDATPVFFTKSGGNTNVCSISAFASNIVCNDNGTPNLASDDTYTFNLTVSPSGPCGTTWTASGSGISGSGTYNTPRPFGPFPISGGNRNFTIADGVNSAITTTVTAVAPAPCSAGAVSTVTFTTCSSNISITAAAGATSAVVTYPTPVATQTGCPTGPTVTRTSPANTASGSAFPIGTTNVVWTATNCNGTTASCAFTITVSAPPIVGTCGTTILTNSDFNSGLNAWSSGTGVTSVGGGVTGAAASMCTNGQRIWQTQSGTAGATYTFEVFAKQATTAPTTGTVAIKFMNSSWTPLVSEFNPIAATANYSRFAVTKVAPAGTAYVEVFVIKETGTGCLLIDDACLGTGGGTSPVCVITASSTEPICNDNGTPNITTDDTYTFALTVNKNAACTGNTYTASLGGGSRNYGTPYTYGPFPISSGGRNITFTDGSSTATTSVNVSAPNTCSNGGGGTPTCIGSILNDGSFEANASWTNWNRDNLTTTTNVAGGANATNNAISICTNGNRVWQTLAATPGKNYQFSVQAKTANGAASGVLSIKFMSSSWIPLTSEFGPINSATTTYKTFTVEEVAPVGTAYIEVYFLKQAGAGCLVLDEACLTDGGSSNPAPCSITASVSNIVCNNNGTPSVPGDDTFTFSITATPSGTCGTTWTGGGKSGSYNTAVSFGPFPISGGNRTISLSDVTNPTATTSVTATAPSTCSGGGTGNGTDLELTLSTPNLLPGIWKTVTCTLTVKNNGTVAANGVTVGFVNQSNTAVSNILAYVSHTAPTGTSFNSWFGDWVVGSLAAGESKVLVYTAFTKSSTSIPIFGQVTAQSPADIDSSPNNNTSGTPAEDDEARIILNGTISLAVPGGERIESAKEFALENFTLYPNPANEVANIAVESFINKNIHLAIVNQLGKVVFDQSIDKLETEIIRLDLNNYQNGLYMVRITPQGQRSIVRKMVVARTF